MSGRYALRTLCALVGDTGDLDDAALLRASLTDIEVLFRGEAAVPDRDPPRCRVPYVTAETGVPRITALREHWGTE